MAEVSFDRSFRQRSQTFRRFFREFAALLRSGSARPDEIVVGLGPGSYAGVRIAIATALGLRTAVRGDPRGDRSICAIDVEEREYCVIGDARRQSFFLARVNDGRLTEGPTLHCRPPNWKRRSRNQACRFMLPSHCLNFLRRDWLILSPDDWPNWRELRSRK